MRNLRFKKGHIYHIYNRGNRKTRIFFQENDNQRFVRTICKYSQEFDMKILAYCLMPNHYHILLKQCGNTTVSVYMQRVGLSYTLYMNKKYMMVGHLFQGAFGAKVVLRTRNLKRVVEYIKGNPVKEGLVERDYDYRWLYVASARDLSL